MILVLCHSSCIFFANTTIFWIQTKSLTAILASWKVFLASMMFSQISLPASVNFRRQCKRMVKPGQNNSPGDPVLQLWYSEACTLAQDEEFPKRSQKCLGKGVTNSGHSLVNLPLSWCSMWLPVPWGLAELRQAVRFNQHPWRSPPMNLLGSSWALALAVSANNKFYGLTSTVWKSISSICFKLAAC